MIAPHRANRTTPPTQDRRRPRRYMRRWLVERFFAWIQWRRRILALGVPSRTAQSIANHNGPGRREAAGLAPPNIPVAVAAVPTMPVATPIPGRVGYTGRETTGAAYTTGGAA